MTGEDGFASAQSDVEPPVGVEWVDDDTAVVGVELTRPMLEWIELEIDDDAYSLASYIRRILWVHLTSELRRSHDFEADVSVDVPEDYARRVVLYADHQRIEGNDPKLEDFVSNHMQFRPTWTVEGEPWDLLEDGDGY